jgi:hypothetical protein
MALGALHRTLDLFAIWTENRLRRESQRARLAAPAPLACFAPLELLDADPPRAGTWRVPSPRPTGPGDHLVVHATPAVGAWRATALLVPPWKTAGSAPLG